MARDIVYWDADCFLGLLNNEADKVSRCRGVMKKAEEGELLIITSALTLIEVIKLKGKPRLKRAAENTIRKFFQNSFIYIHNVDEQVGIEARELMWKHAALKPKDSIHVATALLRKVPKLHTFDRDLMHLSGKYGNPRLRICSPDIQYQMDMGVLYETGKKPAPGQQNSTLLRDSRGGPAVGRAKAKEESAEEEV